MNEKTSDAHGHDDVAIAIAVIGEGTHLTGGLLVFQFDADGSIGGGGEKIQNISGIETDGDGIAFVFLVDIFFRFTVFRAGGRNFHAFRGDGKFHSVGALIGQLRNAPDSVAELSAFEDNGLVVFARQYSFVIWKLTGEDAGNQQAMANLE